jgi:hypothetical protein
MPAQYHKLTYKEGEISLFPNLGALANFEEKNGIGVLDMFSGNGKLPKLDVIYSFLYECHKVACVRRGESAVTFEELKTWTEGKDVLQVFNLCITDLVSELTGDQKKTS